MNPCVSCEEVDDRLDVPAACTLTYEDGYQVDLCRAHTQEVIEGQRDIDARIQFVFDWPTGQGMEYRTTGPIYDVIREWGTA